MNNLLLFVFYLLLTVTSADNLDLPKITSDFFYKTKSIGKEKKTGGREIFKITG